MDYNHKVEWGGYTFYVPDVPYKEEIERGVSQPFIGEQDVLKEFFSEHPQRNNVFIDVGGHIGLFSVPYSKYFKHIYSYEPQEENFLYLIKNLKENKIQNVTPIKKAIMHDADRVNILGYSKDKFLPDDIKPKYSGMYTAIPDSKGNSIATDLNKHFYHEVDFVKIDVEGQEMSVLKSGEEMLKKHKPFLQIEIADFLCLPEQPTKDDLFEYLDSIGYKLFKHFIDYYFIHKDI